MVRVKVDISNSNDGNVEIEFDTYRQDYEIWVHATPETDLATLFGDKAKLASEIAESGDRQLDEFIAAGLEVDDSSFDFISRKKISDSDVEELLDDQLLFMFYGSSISEYMDDNIDFLNEHSVLLPAGDLGIVLDMKALDSKLAEYPNIRNPYILLEGNVSGVPVEAARDTISYINQVSEHVKSLGLSPLEEVIYVYDQIRQREYSEELDGESYEKSRGLSDIILGNNIVCAGYSNLYITILKKLGHNIEEFPLDSLHGGKGHSRVIMKIDDDKYDVHGIFESDPTWASKSAEDPDYLDNYSFLLRRPSYFRSYDRFSGVSNNLESNKAITGLFNGYKEDYTITDYIQWINDFKSLLITVPKLCGDEPLLSMPIGNIERPTRRGFYERIKGYFDMFSKDPDIPSLMSAISTVREVEQKENPEISSGRETMERVFDRYDSDVKDHDRTMKVVFGNGIGKNNS